jgi:predicted TPR repeat methyltransferase
MGVINGKLDRHDRAIHCYRRVIEFDPEFTQALTNLGAMLNTVNQYDQALEQLEKALQIKPDNIQAMFNIANAWRSKDQLDKAAEYYGRVLTLNPNHAEAGYQLSIIHGGPVPDKPPEEYVATLFDQYAWRFDDHLTATLKYQMPAVINETLRKVLPADARKLDVLDVGCGTGLCGVFIRDIASRLVGIDLSSRMLNKAKERRIYDELHVADITAFMDQSPSEYDVVIAADVLPYLGTLDDLFVSCSSSIRDDGIFIFTTEMYEGAQHFVRRSTGRYSHALEYILSLAEGTGFSKMDVSKHIIRMEKETPIYGHLIALKYRSRQLS